MLHRKHTFTAFATLLLTAAVANAQWITSNLAVDGADAANPARVSVLAYDDTSLQVTASAPGFLADPIKTPAGDFVQLSWPDAQWSGQVGAPRIPVIRRLFVVPPRATVSVEAFVAREIAADKFLTAPVAPQQPSIEKLPGARENAEFIYDPAAYNGEYLAEPVTVRELGTMRGQRVFELELRPLAYDPSANTLRFRPQIDVDLTFDGAAAWAPLNPLPAVQNAVLNPVANLPAKRGSGNYLIVTPTEFESAIAAFAAHKANKGFNVSTYVTDGTASIIKSHIASLYANPATAPDYVLLVGDTNLIDHFVGGGTGSPDTDLPYTCMDGAADWYPDFCIGRFPARTVAQLNAIIEKTIFVDNKQYDPAYLQRACFMASVDNYQISEGTHNWVIDNHMIPNDIVSDRLYQVTYGAGTQDVRDSFNDGRFYGIYSGHGGTYSWADGPPFSQADVNGLTNTGMYSFVLSFACVTGTYTVEECFTETWIRAPQKGAVGIYGSSVNSYWDEDDILEKVWFDSIYDVEDQVKAEFGPVFDETRMRFLPYFNDDGMDRRYFEMYNLMGDPALSFPVGCSDQGTLVLNSAKFACESELTAQLDDCGLNLDNAAIDTFDLVVTSDSEPLGEIMTITETDVDSGQFEGTLTLSATDAPGILWVSEGDTVSIQYIDEDDGQGGTNVLITVDATIDCTAPTIANVTVADVGPRDASITFDADENVYALVHYGTECGNWTGTASGGPALSPSVTIEGLQDTMDYYFMVEAIDEAGNAVTDDNLGDCYAFTTPEYPDFYTETLSGTCDLQNTTVTFSPDGSVDIYAGCAETGILNFPIDPAGGNTVSLGDDDAYQVTLTNGAQVYLYGVAYNSFYIGSNGYLTFGQSDTAYSESLDAHFEMPRISMLFDDLRPGAGTNISYKQLADRVVVTYENISEYSPTNTNSFQVELHFNGDIVITWLTIQCTDAIIGLSEGPAGDYDPAFFLPTDLSALSGCEPRPPSAFDANYETGFDQPVEIQLIGSDDGTPNPLLFVIDSLPAVGDLTDPDAGLIDSTPYTLLGDTVVYTPDTTVAQTDTFTFFVDDGGVPPTGGVSAPATVSILIGRGPFLSFPLDTDPGWTTEGDWAFGVPAGIDGDPTSGFTGDNVYGYNLNGEYTDNMTPTYLTTTALDCTDATGVELQFMRWLGVESASYDHANIEISTDGNSWSQVWAHTGSTIEDNAWVLKTYDIAAIADQQPTVFIRWGMGGSDGSVTYCGWNIDDVQLWGVVQAPGCTGDLNGDNIVDASDLNILLSAWGSDGGPADINGDNIVDAADLNLLLSDWNCGG